MHKTSIASDSNIENPPYLEAILNEIGITRITSIERISSGQVNRVYLVNNKLIVRFSDGLRDGRTFKKEAKVIAAIGERVATPEIIYADCSRIKVPFDIIVAKKKIGETLALKWPSSSSSQQKKYIQNLSGELRKLHALPTTDFSFLMQNVPWHIRFKKYVNNCISAAESDNEINQDCVAFLKDYFMKFQGVLNTPHTRALVHGDVHFENILVNDRGIQSLLDFEYSDIAPLDFELAKIINFCLYPKKFVELSIEHRYNGINLLQVIRWMKEYYPELFAVDHLIERQRIYLIPDTLWGFKWALIQKDSRKITNKPNNFIIEDGTKEETLKAMKRYRDIYHNKIFEQNL